MVRVVLWRSWPNQPLIKAAFLGFGLLLAQPQMGSALARAAIQQGQPQSGLRVVDLVIQTSAKAHHYRVEVAETAEQQAYGMMFRRQMAANTGMIFPMKPAREASFWMQNTLISLDLIFIGVDGRVRNIAANAVPHSLDPLSSLGPIAAVLELKGGEAARIGLKPGDKIRW